MARTVKQLSERSSIITWISQHNFTNWSLCSIFFPQFSPHHHACSCYSTTNFSITNHRATLGFLEPWTWMKCCPEPSRKVDRGADCGGRWFPVLCGRITEESWSYPARVPKWSELNNEAVLKDVLWVILEGQFQNLRHPHFTHAITMSFFVEEGNFWLQALTCMNSVEDWIAKVQGSWGMLLCFCRVGKAISNTKNRSQLFESFKNTEIESYRP